MRMYDIIAQKRDGRNLSEAQIRYFVEHFSKDEIPDYQASALMMAIYLNGMNDEEMITLVKAMIASGDTIDLSAIGGTKVDKHSTGGVGDKTSIVLAPLVAAAGVSVAKMSGRGLGHTGGTIDKLEAIPGFGVEMSAKRFAEQVNAIGLAISGQTANLVPADKKMYALRDVTATIESLPLIASSIMSKKLASGADAIVLDVKTGSGAFMKQIDDAFQLAEKMVAIGNGMGKKTIALITDMEQPLGNAIGNALELKEAILTLRGKGPEDLTEICYALGIEMLIAAGVTNEHETAYELLEEAIESGRAIEKLKAFIEWQGGDATCVEQPEKLGHAAHTESFVAVDSGFISEITAEAIGVASLQLGAGRLTKEDQIDLLAGIELQAKVGDHVKAGQVLATLHTSDSLRFEAAFETVKVAIRIDGTEPLPVPLVHGRVG